MRIAWLPWLTLPLFFAACSAPPSHTVTSGPACVQEGLASWYARQPGLNRTADGRVFNPAALTAAHRSLPFGTRVRVVDLDTGRTVVVQITDRGPAVRSRIIDLSEAAATALAMRHGGLAHVRLEPADAGTCDGWQASHLPHT